MSDASAAPQREPSRRVADRQLKHNKQDSDAGGERKIGSGGSGGGGRQAQRDTGGELASIDKQRQQMWDLLMAVPLRGAAAPGPGLGRALRPASRSRSP
jgi:hypothetical protein